MDESSTQFPFPSPWGYQNPQSNTACLGPQDSPPKQDLDLFSRFWRVQAHDRQTDTVAMSASHAFSAATLSQSSASTYQRHYYHCQLDFDDKMAEYN